MNSHSRICVALTATLALCVVVGNPAQAETIDAGGLQESLNEYPHAQKVSFSKREVIDHEVGLGGIRKVRGEWQFKDSERLSGTLVSYTWQIVDGFTSAEVMVDLIEEVEGDESASLLFSCQGRACGQGAQWANRVFRERLLYGREDLQRYAVYELRGSPQYRLITYSAARTEDRQYLRVDLLELTE